MSRNIVDGKETTSDSSLFVLLPSVKFVVSHTIGSFKFLHHCLRQAVLHI